MPTLNAPLTATYTTSTPGEFVVVVATGANDAMLVSWVGPGGISGQRTVRNTTTNGEDIGPFTDQTTVTFTALSGSPGYTAPGIPAGVSGAGNMTRADSVVMGDSLTQQCHYFWYGAGAGAGFVAGLSRTGGVVTASITSHGLYTGKRVKVLNSDGFTGTFVVTRVDANTVTWSDTRPDAVADRSAISIMDLSYLHGSGYFVWLNARLKGGLRLLSNEGIGGQTTTQILARVGEVIAMGPGRVFLMGGYNDMNKAGFTAAVTAQNLIDAAKQLMAAGIMVHLGSMIPMGPASAKWSAANNEYILQVNRLLKAWVATAGRGVTFTDLYAALVDGTNTVNKGAAKTDMLGADGTHQATRGAFAMGKAFAADVLASGFVPVSPLPRSPADSRSSVASNPNCLVQSPWATGGSAPGAGVTGPNFYLNVFGERNSGTGTAVTSNAIAANGTPRQRLDITPAGAEQWQIRSGGDGATILGYMVPGKSYQIMLQVDLTNLVAANLKDVLLRFQMVAGGVTYFIDAGSTSTGSALSDSDEQLTLVSEPFVCPAGLTNCLWITQVNLFAASGSALGFAAGQAGLIELA